ncbi:MAG: tyrosine--tRNA ligase [Gemmatimonadaceae bacterium]|nr:tyrosine--tRNA ligase [Gemmatimonadaceae bacterium]
MTTLPLPEETRTPPLFTELGWRELLHQHTEGAGAHLLAGATAGYVGFDPTASSLHVGHLVGVMALVHLQRAGHRPIAMVGGGTGLIGDPSGRRSERQLLSVEAIDANVAALQAQLERFLDFTGPQAAKVLNNADWLRRLDLIGFLRDVGKHFTVNYMLQKESVAARMDDGISFTEFSYMLLQAYDFLELSRREGVTLQLGGSDQWGNITAGTELIRRTTGRTAHGVTLPLVTTASGEKFGKSAGNAVWLDAAQTSPYRFFQFWMQAEDASVSRYLRFFTLLEREAIEALDLAVRERPHARDAQRMLAREVTTRVHGADAAQAAEQVSTILFSKGADPRALSREALAMLREEVPSVRYTAPADGALPPGDVDVLQCLVLLGLCESRGAAKRVLEQGGLTVNGVKLGAADRTVRAETALAGGHLLVRKGAREYGVVVLE